VSETQFIVMFIICGVWGLVGFMAGYIKGRETNVRG
jgi:hypothetical protein